MTAEMTIILLNYKRPKNIPIILDSIRRQTIKPVVFLWNNGPDDVNFLGVDRYEKSSENVGCMVRWKMAREADTPYVMSLDDDLCFARDDALADVVESLRTMDDPARIVGSVGCCFGKDPSYTERSDVYAKYAPADTNEQAIPTTGYEAVDMVKGRVMALRRDRLDGLELPEEREDDIFLSAAVAGGRRRFHRIPMRLNYAFRELPELGVGNWMRPGHLHSRDRAAAEYFRPVLPQPEPAGHHRKAEPFQRAIAPDIPARPTTARSNGAAGASGRVPGEVSGPWRPRRRGAIHERDGKQLLIRLGEGDGARLNPTAALIWERCDGTRTEAEILAELRELFGAPEDLLRRDLCEALEGLIDVGALEPDRKRDFYPLTNADDGHLGG